MAESIGLIERATARLRQREVGDRRPIPESPAGAALSPAAQDPAPIGRRLVLDRRRLARYGITIPSSSRSRTVEEFRLVKRNLMTAWSQSDPIGDRRSSRLIMVTSAGPREGKTFSSVNLALAFASERDIKALLVDVDTQHSTLPEILGIPEERGIVEVLAGSLELSEVLIRTNIPNLMIVPVGGRGPHVPELLSSNKMAALMTEMTQHYCDSVIILNTPPCMTSSDAAALAPLVGQVVFVVEAHVTQQAEIEAGLSMLRACPRTSLLLVKSDTCPSEHFSTSGYGSRSPDGENDELPSAN